MTVRIKNFIEQMFASEAKLLKLGNKKLKHTHRYIIEYKKLCADKRLSVMNTSCS